MQYAPVRLADLPVSGVMCGIDWARDDHAVAIIDRDAHVRYRGVAEHSARPKGPDRNSGPSRCG